MLSKLLSLHVPTALHLEKHLLSNNFGHTISTQFHFKRSGLLLPFGKLLGIDNHLGPPGRGAWYDRRCCWRSLESRGGLVGCQQEHMTRSLRQDHYGSTDLVSTTWKTDMLTCCLHVLGCTFDNWVQFQIMDAQPANGIWNITRCVVFGALLWDVDKWHKQWNSTAWPQAIERLISQWLLQTWKFRTQIMRIETSKNLL